MNDIKSSVYAQKVELLLRLIPIVMDEGVFAIHGGTAINLFLKNLPRYSVDIDLTYIPLAGRQTLIGVVLGNPDPTNGSRFWDGSDFLAWGTGAYKDPKGIERVAHPKFFSYP